MTDPPPTERERWDGRYASEAPDAERAPEPRVTEALARLVPAPRSAFDLAAGSGRHSLWLAARGVRVEAWDISPVGLGLLARRAAARGLEVGTRAVDLSQGLPDVPPRDLVLVVDYLDRALLGRLHALLAPGGAAIVCTFTDELPGPHPSRRFRLRRGELRSLPGLTTERREEREGRALLLARRGTEP